MNQPAIDRNNRIIRIIQNVIKSFDGIFDPTNESHSKFMAETIIKSLKRNGIIDGYKP